MDWNGVELGQGGVRSLRNVQVAVRVTPALRTHVSALGVTKAWRPQVRTAAKECH